MGEYSEHGIPRRISEEESGLVWDEKKKAYRPSGLTEEPGQSKSKWTEGVVMGWVVVVGGLLAIIGLQVWGASANPM